MIFESEKTPFQAVKTRSRKIRQIEIFPKGLVHGFGAKLAIFPCFFFRKSRPVKCVIWYSWAKKRFSRQSRLVKSFFWYCRTKKRLSNQWIKSIVSNSYQWLFVGLFWSNGSKEKHFGIFWPKAFVNFLVFFLKSLSITSRLVLIESK